MGQSFRIEIDFSIDKQENACGRGSAFDVSEDFLGWCGCVATIAGGVHPPGRL